MVLLPAAAQTSGPTNSPTDNLELQKIQEADQADRQPSSGSIDWSLVTVRDRAREAQVEELYRQGKLLTGTDYFNAALVLQHGSKPEDYLLAHELCVVAIIKGNVPARWLAAATEDRFLMNIGRPQRFGTQYRPEPGKPSSPMRLYQVDDGSLSSTDELRKQMNAPSLAAAQEREETMADMTLPLEARAEKYEKRLRGEPGDLKALQRLIEIYAEMKRPEKARDLSVRALEIDPNQPVVQYNLACFYAREGRKKEALGALERAFHYGFSNRAWMEKDSDLESIRAEPEYSEMIRRYFP